MPSGASSSDATWPAWPGHRGSRGGRSDPWTLSKSGCSSLRSKGERWEALYLVALGCGLRQGEILGLAWGDLDLEAGTLRVHRALQRVEGAFAFVEPKSATSCRIVALPAIVRLGLLAHRERAAVAGPAQTPLAGFGDLVFTTRVGTPIDGISVTRRFQRILTGAGLPQQRFHDLRHACASLLLSQGVPARVVMETLGHSQISLTLNPYSHVILALGRRLPSGWIRS
jgi:integrase